DQRVQEEARIKAEKKAEAALERQRKAEEAACTRQAKVRKPAKKELQVVPPGHEQKLGHSTPDSSTSGSFGVFSIDSTSQSQPAHCGVRIGPGGLPSPVTPLAPLPPLLPVDNPQSSHAGPSTMQTPSQARRSIQPPNQLPTTPITPSHPGPRPAHGEPGLL
ncbi:hypothetical protein FS749_015064, partial [Ceratobasidium sp. UAMH 11750]